MLRVNIHDIKAHLSAYLQKVEHGETLIICKRNIPIAEVKPIKETGRKRPLGFAKSLIEISDNFNDPLPENILKQWGIKEKNKTKK